MGETKMIIAIFTAFLLIFAVSSACNDNILPEPAPELTPDGAAGGQTMPPAATPEPSAPEAQVPPAAEPPAEPPAEPETEPLLPDPVTIKLQFAGDILLHGFPVRNAKIGEDEYDFNPFFQLIKPYIDGDLSICNMESPVDSFGGNTNLSAYPRFNVPREILGTLKDAGFNHLITANNHAFDQGIAGIEATLSHIRETGLGSTGTYMDKEEFETPTLLDINGITVGIIAYTDSYNGRQTAVPADRLPYLMRSFGSYYNLDDVPRMADDIKELRGAGAELVVVSVHWGEEYVDTPRANRRAIAQALCEAGADIIMGHHPHCVQPIEWYAAGRDGKTVNCLIIFSLGNFFADQIELDPPHPKTQYGMLVDVYATKSSEGIVTLDDFKVLPTLMYRSRIAGADRYRIMPLDNIHTEERPEFIPDNAAWDWAKQAYEHVVEVTGIGEENLR